MSNFTFLNTRQVGGIDNLEILQKYGLKSAITDFSILLGGIPSTPNQIATGLEDGSYTGDWMVKSNDKYNGDNTIQCVLKDGRIINWSSIDERKNGARPIVPYSQISSIITKKEKNQNEVLEVEYGEYPQTVADENISQELEKLYQTKKLNETGKSYTTDSITTAYAEKEIPFQARKHIEYEYQNQKYIRFIGDANCSQRILSDGRIIQENAPYWIKVEPIKWLIDEKTDIALSKKIIFAGIRFDQKGIREFKDSEIKKFMDTYFSKEILTKREIELQMKNKENIVSTKEDIKNKRNFTLPDYIELFHSELLELCIAEKSYLTDFTVSLGSMGEEYNGKIHGPIWTQSCTTDYNYMSYRYDYDLRENIPNGFRFNDNQVIVGGYLRVGNGLDMSPKRDYISSVIKVPYQDIEDLIIEKSYDQIYYIDRKKNNEERPIITIKAGEYPQSVVTEEMQKELTEASKKGQLLETGKIYSIDGGKVEYEYKGKKYIRHQVITDKFHSYKEEVTLSNGQKYKTGDEIWIEVQPIEWMVSEKTGIAISRKALFSGIAFDNKDKYEGDFENTNIKNFLDNSFAKDIEPSKLLNPKTNYSLEEIECDEYLRKQIKEMSDESKFKVVAHIAEELITKIELARRYALDLGEDFGKLFDKQMQQEKINVKENKVKVK